MKIQSNQQSNSVQLPRKSKVSIASNLIREKEMIDQDGNTIDPRTKQVIKKASL